ncbi:unnamed protein product [Paramecium sonneborni]|uniref:Uncharacterized protein n=1 Tax=Paramecium sonneborni TaxID=65129 RepID=A0A8S1KTW9_9CILI|nr:unnamed protein product [Paramecium sonneborni]
MNHLLFEEALVEEDEFQRLSKISDAIKLVAGAIMRIKTFNNWQILKYMICSYPFQQEVIQLLMNTIFDYFQDIDFLNAFEKALLEIAQLKEQRIFLSSRSQSIRIGVLQQNYNNVNIRKEKIKQTYIPFAKAVIEQMTVAKKFAASFLKKYIQLAKILDQDIKQRVYIIKDFVVNTRDHHFILLLINTFQELKESDLKDEKWVDDFDQEVQQYCQLHNILVPRFLEKQNKPQLDKSQSGSDQDEDSFQQNLQSQSNSTSEKQSLIDEEEMIQKWIAQKSINIEQQQLEILSKDENMFLLISFILNPEEEIIDDYWKDQYPMQDINDDGISNKIRNQKIEFYALVRSFQTAQVFHHRQNLEKMQQNNQSFLQKFYKKTSEALQNKNRNLNLYHLALTIDSFLTVFPKSSMALILENQLLFSLSTYIFNPLIMGLLIDIHQIQFNKYDFGLTYIEQIWKYQLFTDWFTWLQNIMFEQDNDSKQLEKQFIGENIQFIIKCLKELSKKEQKIPKPKISDDNKIKLTSLFGSLLSGKSLTKQNVKDYENWKMNIKLKEHLTIEEFKSQDYDNLMEFIKQREFTYKQQLEKKIQDEIQIQIDNIQLKRSSRVRMSQTKSNHYQSPISNSKLILQSNSSIKSQSDSQPNSSRSIKLPSIYGNNQYIESKFGSISSLSPQGEINFELKTRNLSTFGQSPKNIKLNIPSQRRLKTENDELVTNSIQSNDGFSSSRLITIYPSKQAQIKFEQSKIVLKQDQIIVENCLNFFSEILKTILDFFQQPNKTNLQQLNEQILIQQILSMNFLNQIFELYLSSLIDQNVQQQKIGENSGQMINLIYHKSHHIELFQLLREQLRTIFLSNVDNLTRAIVAINKQIRSASKFVNKFQLQLLLSTYFYGFNLFSIHTQLVSTSNIYKHLNETVMHIFIIWFFDSQQNSCYQYFFAKFLTILFAKAPIQSLTNILFNLGLINSIYNAFQSFWVNGMKSNYFQAGVYFYMRMLIYMINKSLIHRNMTVLQEYLRPLESWKVVYRLIPDEDSNYMIELQELLKTGQTPIRRIQLKRTKLEKLKTQLTVDCFDAKLREIQQFEQAQKDKLKKSSSPKILQQGKKIQNRQSVFKNRTSLKNDI